MGYNKRRMESECKAAAAKEAEARRALGPQILENEKAPGGLVRLIYKHACKLGAPAVSISRQAARPGAGRATGSAQRR